MLIIFHVFISSLSMRTNVCSAVWPIDQEIQTNMNNLSRGYEDPWQVAINGCTGCCFCFLLLSFALAGQRSVSPPPPRIVPATLQNSLIKRLPDSDVASPAVRRARQTASRMEVNKPKCAHMLRDRLLSDQRGSHSTHLLRLLLVLTPLFLLR